jgi:hypothetical protein
MPKRMLDDSLLTSPSVAACSPYAQDAFPRLILIADDFGCFDANPRVIVGKAWPLRPDVSEASVAGWLDEYEAAGMLQRWDEGGRTWGFLTGWFGPHGQRDRGEYDAASNPRGSRRKTPKPPPIDYSRRVRGEVAAGSPPQSQSQSQSQEEAFAPPPLALAPQPEGEQRTLLGASDSDSAPAATKAAKAKQPRQRRPRSEETYDGRTQAEALAYLRGVACDAAKDRTGFPGPAAWTEKDNGALVSLLRRCARGVPEAAVAIRGALALKWPDSFAKALSKAAVKQGAPRDIAMALQWEQVAWDVHLGARRPPPTPEQLLADSHRALAESVAAQAKRPPLTPLGGKAVGVGEWVGGVVLTGEFGALKPTRGTPEKHSS